MTITLPQGQLGLNLQRGNVVDLHPTRTGITLGVQKGRLWVTQTGDPVDHILAEGETFHTSAPGLLVVEALEASELNAS